MQVKYLTNKKYVNIYIFVDIKNKLTQKSHLSDNFRIAFTLSPSASLKALMASIFVTLQCSIII